MKKNGLLLRGALAAMLIAGFVSAANAQVPTKVDNGILTNSAGMTLYEFDIDSLGKSVCNGPCAAEWPPFLAHDSDQPSGDYSIIIRNDGKRQWALKGRPLYTWAKDQKPGDKTGDGFRNIWHVVRP
jgi:predicted lipoprotein with Yx(FWY)xxD motif